jgi:hypothetical protein
LLAALDPVRFARAAGLAPDDWQQAVLRSDAPRLLLNCCRQSGKSTVTALVALHTAIYAPGSLILLLSPGLRQSAELFRKVLDAYRGLGRPAPATAESLLRLELVGGSRIVALPGNENTVRGYSGAALLCVDEASRTEDALYFSIRPMLAVSGGRIIALSTPWGRRGWWFTAWQEEPDWHKVEVPACALGSRRSSWPPSSVRLAPGGTARSICVNSRIRSIRSSARRCWPPVSPAT